MQSHSTRALPAAAAFTFLLLLGSFLATPTDTFAQTSRRGLPSPGQPSQPMQPGQPIQPIPARPTVIPARPVVITPAQPKVTYPARPVSPGVVTPSQPIVTKPISPGVPSPGFKPKPPITTLPVKPGLPPPSQPVKPVPLPKPVPFPPYPCPPYYPQYPIVVIPSYPSAYIGPEIMSVTTYPTENEVANVPAPPQGQGQMQPGDPAALQGDAATPRLIAILGRIERVDAGLPLGSSGAGVVTQATGRDGDQLCLAFGTLTSYYNPDPDQPTEAMARGTYFGSRWDGDAWHTSATGLWSRGPVTRQPIFTLHELQPSAFPFEVARPGHRITSLRMAIALVRDTASPSTSPSAVPSQTQKRHLTMANSLRRHLQESNEPIPLAPPSSSSSSSSNSSSTPGFPSPDPSETYLGNAHSPFGQALATSLQELLSTSSFPASGSVSQPSTQNSQPAPASASQPSTFNSQLIGSAEYTLPLSDLRDIMGGCPRFTTIPLPADLQTVRSRDTSPAPLWVRPFRIEVGAESGSQPVTYQGEVWFLIVPDGTLRTSSNIQAN